MHVSNISIYASPTREVEAWKSNVQPQVASTHLPTYNIIGASPRPRGTEDDVSGKHVLGTRKSSSTSSTPSPSSILSARANAGAKASAPVTRENLSKISMACAREEDLDAPYSVSSVSRESRNWKRDNTKTRTRTRTRTSTGSDTSNDNSETGSDLPSISEEEE